MSKRGNVTITMKMQKNASIVYLTRFGDAPSEYSREKKGGTDILSLIIYSAFHGQMIHTTG